MQGNNRNTQGAEIKCIFYVSFYALPRKIHLWCCHSKTSSARLTGSSTSACSNMKKSFTHQKNNLQKSNKSTDSFNQKIKDIIFEWYVYVLIGRLSKDDTWIHWWNVTLWHSDWLQYWLLCLIKLGTPIRFYFPLWSLLIDSCISDKVCPQPPYCLAWTDCHNRLPSWLQFSDVSCQLSSPSPVPQADEDYIYWARGTGAVRVEQPGDLR